ncbi:MAG: hypothetical protein JJ971_05745 [Balneolaceae bacterium]|nr:hypothetical protein [Balneolaceae bacterium]MBO6545881.1 hypothetical protein [Balneolaceae bacterium]MBO6647277.1 hypothetical protein [Balneolaceae bacterium]
MQKLFYILIFVLLFSLNAFAQKTATATMRISATILSGVTLNHVKAIDVDVNEGNQAISSFEFTTPRHLDSDVEVKEKIILKNEFGDQIEFISESEHQARNGKHRIILKASVELPSTQHMHGHYQGDLTTTINYL